MIAGLRSAPISPHLRVGAGGERLASRHLRRHGYRVIARNLRTPVGEVDLLCLAPDRRTVVVVEVKTRCYDGNESGRSRLPPELALNAAKKRKLLAIAQDLIRRKKWSGRTVRIDLIAIDLKHGEEPVLRHHINAVPKPSR
ncbi:MAG: YraN family protein [Phycisphaerales bacterium JB065]